ncbi:MAG TPA: sulfatase-like hydrolase/transferase [Candidatus Dormibacteraeota bacterium]|nr:sulfatase-like hydrolase/transferase [Candidatus Dormibacteraeota bacterium]
MRRSALLFVLLIAVALPLWAEAPNIVFITVDTTRADRMGFLGNKQGLTPNLDLVARQGIVFERAYSQAPLTPVSHATIFTGTYPQFHTVTDFGHPLPALLPYMPDILQKAGYHTAAFIGSLILDPHQSMAPGFDRGFGYFDAGFRPKNDPDEDRYTTVERRAGDVVGHAITWLTRNPRAPFFVWVHLYDPHAPYDPPAPYDKRFKDPYDGEIAYADASLGKLFTYLREKGLYDHTIIVMMSDHGESLGAHGESMHGIFLYDETIHVPLIFKLPAELLANRRVSTRVRLVDVAPTLLSMLSLPLPPTFQGESLVPLMKGVSRDKDAADLPAYAETDYPHRAFGWSALRSLRSGKYLFVHAPKRELYDQSQDKDAAHNLAATSPAVASTLQSQIDEFHDKTAVVRDKAADAPLTAEQAENLSALGYVASTGAAQSADVLQGADPKDKIGISNVLQQGMIAVEDGRYQEAIPLLKQVLADSPLVTAAQLQLGMALAKTKHYPEAIVELRKSVAQLPDSVQSQYELGLALFETGSWKDSVPYFEYVAKKRPKWADAQYSLAAVYARTQHVPEAVDLLQTVLQLNPQHFRANLLLGRILTLQHHAQDALPYLKQAVDSAPDNFEPHAFLADALDELGDAQTAAAERTKAQALKQGTKPKE